MLTICHVDRLLTANTVSSLGGVFVHGQLEGVLGAVLPVEGGRVVVQVHHADHHRGRPVIQQFAILTHL